MSDEIRNEIRAEVRRRRLGEQGVKACTLCGETTPAVLRRASRALVEFHHLAGEANDPDLGVFLCLTHHRLCTELMCDRGVPLDRAARRSLLERLASLLDGLAVFFEIAARLLQVWAGELRALISALDRSQPGWRELGEAS
jgi:hypothetical protein